MALDSFFSDEKDRDPKDDRLFVDREEFLKIFNDSVDNIGKKEFNILVYHGIAGIGKTSLRKELSKHLEKRKKINQQQKIIWASIDLEEEKYREKCKFLETLKSELQDKHRIHFHDFEFAHTVYCNKINSETTLRKENNPLSEDNAALCELIGDFLSPNFNIVLPTVKLMIKFSSHFESWRRNRGTELIQLKKKEPREIKEKLPYFWAQDLNNYLNNTSKTAVLFIDTYEALWYKHGRDGYSQDKWIREELIPNVPKNVLWVICGREELGWKETKSYWSEYITQRQIINLPKKNCIEYLENNGVTDEKIQDTIYNGSEGVPYYLELSVLTFLKILKSGKEPKSEDFGDNYQEIVGRFFRSLSFKERTVLKVLSFPRFWDYDLFEYLATKSNVKFYTNNFEDLCKYSFINIYDNKKYQMHKLMQKALQETQSSDSVKRIHNDIAEYYTNKLKKIEIRAITPEHESALREAFYHAKESLEATEFLKWFIDVSEPFNRAAFWELISSLYEKMLPLLEEKLGSKHPCVAKALNKHALLYCHMGDYKEAIRLLQKSLEISRENQDRHRESVVLESEVLESEVLESEVLESEVLGNLGLVERKLSQYDKAVNYLEQALKISKKIERKDLEVNHLGNLGNVYRDKGDFDKAICNYKEALKIAVEIEDKPGESINFGNLGLVDRELGKYGEAVEDLEHALKIAREKERKDLEVNHLGNLGNVYRDKGDFDKAIHIYYKKALEIAIEIGDRRNVGIWFGNCGSAFRFKGKLNIAVRYHEQALGFARLIGDKRYEGIWLGNRGIAYYSQGKLNKAINDFDLALKIAREIGDKRYEGIWLGNLGIAYYDQVRLDKSFYFYEQALNIAREISDVRNVGVWLGYFGNAYLGLGQLKEAIEYYKLALKIAGKIGDKRREGKWKGHIGNAYLYLDQPKEAIDFFKQSLEIATEIGDRRRVETWTEKLVNAYCGLRDPKKAIEVLSESLTFGKSIEDQGIIDFCEKKLKELEGVNE